MKIALVIARIALGALMVFSGLNKFFAFVPVEPFTGEAGRFMAILAESDFLGVVAVLEVAGGAMLITGFFVPLGIVLLGPVIVNIALFHGLIAGDWLFPMAVVAELLFVVTLAGHFRAFRPVLRPTMGPAVD
jgi:uncharacterized membrane protein YphA (DoxX/SURF4 family)